MKHDPKVFLKFLLIAMVLGQGTLGQTNWYEGTGQMTQLPPGIKKFSSNISSSEKNLTF